MTRIDRLRARMAEAGVDLTAIGPTAHLRWLTGLDPHGDERPVMLLVGGDYAGFLMPALNADSVRQGTDLPFHLWRDEDGPRQALADLLGACGVAGPVTVSVDETMRADFALMLLDALPGARRQFTEATVSALREEKDENEYQALKASAALNDRAVMAGFGALREGVAEREIAAVIAATYEAEGAAPEFLSVCFGGNGAFPHHHTGDTRLSRDVAVLIDAGGRLDGYPSDMTRVGWFGTPSEEFLKVVGVVERAVQAGVAAARPGQPASAVDAAARGVIAAAGYGAFFTHRTGHGLGIEVHETPYITATSMKPLKAGNVFSIEPGIYLPNRFGLRLEEIVFLREGGAEILSGLPRAPVIVSA